MNNLAMFKITYGLYVVTACENDVQNGCIVNTFAQVTDTPNRVSITVNKNNHTHDMIKNTGNFVVSMLTEKTNFDIFKHFGFQSGRDVNKFENFTDVVATENGVYAITKDTNAYVCGKVLQEIDLGTHTMFIADVVGAEVLNEDNSLTYAYYHKHTKPQPKKVETEKESYVCNICGFIYDGELPIPADYVCPLCMHGVDAFEVM